MQGITNQILKTEKNITFTDNNIFLAKYFIADYLKDLEDDLINKNYFAFAYNISLLTNCLIEVFCKKYKIPLVKSKYQKDKINQVAPKFSRLFEEFSKAKNYSDQYKKIKKLSNYVLKSLGGSLSQEWEIENDLTV